MLKVTSLVFVPFCSIWQVSSGRRCHSLSMPETRTTEAVGRRTGRRLPAGTSADVPYKPHHRLTVEERSPYQTRPTEPVVSGDVREEEEEELDLGEIVDGSDRDSSVRTEMSGSGDDGDVRALLRFMLEKEERSEQTRRERKRGMRSVGEKGCSEKLITGGKKSCGVRRPGGLNY